MVDFIDQEKGLYGVEPICNILPIASSTYYNHKRLMKNPHLRSERCKQDEILMEQINRVWQENRCVYGARKVWKQLLREGITVARCTVARLMKVLGIKGVVRGKSCKTTISSELDAKPLDLVNRSFGASKPNELWVADITYVWTRSGYVYVAFVVDVFARMIVGWRVLKTMDTSLVLDALEQALWARGRHDDLVHHSDRGSQYLSITYTDRLIEAGIEASVGSVGDSYDNALAETINGLYKTELIYHEGPYSTLEEVEIATLGWVNWYNNHRLFSSIGDVPPVEKEMMYYTSMAESANAA